VAKIPEAYRQHGTFTPINMWCTPGGDSRCLSTGAISKFGPAKTNHIERFNNTLRQRVSSWYARRYHFPRSFRGTISVPLSSSSATTTSRELRRRASITWTSLPGTLATVRFSMRRRRTGTAAPISAPALPSSNSCSRRGRGREARAVPIGCAWPVLWVNSCRSVA